MIITFSYLSDDRTELSSSWTGDVDAAIEDGRELLCADEHGVYFDDATQSRWQSSDDDLAVLGAAILGGHGDSPDLYSLWCASHPAGEVAS